DGQTPSVRQVARGRQADDLVVERSLIEAMLVRQECVRVQIAGGRSAMGAPLLAGGRALGFIYVDDRGRVDRFADDELDFLNALPHLAAGALEKARERQRLADVAEALRADRPLAELLGESEVMRRVGQRLRRYARSPDTPVLVLGESGTGKELAART